MGKDLVEIEPRELRFPFELKKQSSCSVHLVNKTNDHVAFKVKTTSPKRYCVRPNTGVIPPRSSFDFTVSMQAQRTAPPDMQLKDKFLVQTTVVPYGTIDEDIVADFFSKENGRYIAENKLRVVLVTLPDYPVLQPINGTAGKEEPTFVKEAPAAVTESLEAPILLKEYPVVDPPKAPSTAVLKQSLVIEPPKVPAVVNESPTAYKEYSPIPKESPVSADTSLNKFDDLLSSHVTEDVENLKSKLINLELKLDEAERVIGRLRDVSKTTTQERDKLQKEMGLQRRKSTARIQVGYPLRLVVYMALVGMTLGYLFHP